jgi:hypothetical protein
VGTAVVREVEEAAAACLDFLRSRQSTEGSWTDWDLPPGRSSMWTTAYVGCQLARLRPRLQGSASEAMRRTACWLTEHELPDGGWGYDGVVGCDADSTAHAIVAITLSGGPVADRSCRRLESFQQPDGGFSTYAADDGLGSWGESHADVTPVAAHALLLVRGRADVALARAIAYVTRRRNGAGLWDSFWWSTPLYATRASLALLAAADARLDLASTRASLLEIKPESAFERALLVDCLGLAGAGTGSTARRLVEALVGEQLGDGSWASVPSLRIPDRTCAAPWRETHTGPLYADPDRLFTSATVLGALSRAMGPGGPRLAAPQPSSARSASAACRRSGPTSTR